MKPRVKKKSSEISTDLEDWTVIYCDTVEEVEECVSDSTVIWPIMQRTITRIIDERRETLPAIEIRCSEMIGSVWVTCNLSDSAVSLSKLLKWREGREEYEECSEVVELIGRLAEFTADVSEGRRRRKSASSVKSSKKGD